MLTIYNILNYTRLKEVVPIEYRRVLILSFIIDICSIVFPYKLITIIFG